MTSDQGLSDQDLEPPFRGLPSDTATDGSLPAKTWAWVSHGLISPEQREAILTAEGLRSPLAATPATGATPPARRSSALIETFGYLGGVLTLAAALLLAQVIWDDLSTLQRVALPAVASALLLAAGLLVRPPVGETGALGRLRGALWALGTVAFAVFLGLLGDLVLGWGPRDVWLLLSAGSAALAAALFAWTQQVLQHLTTFAFLAATAGGLAARIDVVDSPWPGLAVCLVALAWFVLDATGWLRPPRVGRYVGSVAALFGSLLTGEVGWGRLLTLAVVASLFVLGARLNDLALLGIGAVGALVAVPVAVQYFFPGDVAVPVALLVTGGVLIGVAVVVARRRRPPPDLGSPAVT